MTLTEIIERDHVVPCSCGQNHDVTEILRRAVREALLEVALRCDKAREAIREAMPGLHRKTEATRLLVAPRFAKSFAAGKDVQAMELAQEIRALAELGEV